MYISSYLCEEMEAADPDELKGTETDQIASQHKSTFLLISRKSGAHFISRTPLHLRQISHIPPLDPPQPLAREG